MAEGIDIVGSDTENHLMTVDLRKLDKTGKDISNELEEVGITANKNTVPNDPKSPFYNIRCQNRCSCCNHQGIQRK